MAAIGPNLGESAPFFLLSVEFFRLYEPHNVAFFALNDLEIRFANQGEKTRTAAQRAVGT